MEQPKLYIVDFSIRIVEKNKAGETKTETFQRFKSFPMLLIDGEMPDKQYEMKYIDKHLLKYNKINKNLTIHKSITNIENAVFSSKITYKYKK